MTPDPRDTLHEVFVSRSGEMLLTAWPKGASTQDSRISQVLDKEITLSIPSLWAILPTW